LNCKCVDGQAVARGIGLVLPDDSFVVADIYGGSNTSLKSAVTIPFRYSRGINSSTLLDPLVHFCAVGVGQQPLCFLPQDLAQRITRRACRTTPCFFDTLLRGGALLFQERLGGSRYTQSTPPFSFCPYTTFGYIPMSV